MANGRRSGQNRKSGGIRGLALFRRLPALRATGAIAGAFALLIQAWLPWAHHPGGAVAAERPGYALAAPSGYDPALCLAQGNGMQDRSGAPAELPPHKAPPCPICQALHMLGGFIPPASGLTVADPRPASLPDVTGQAPIIARALDPTWQPRAPPAMA